ncbi:retrovirus-related pol polyprotein from transposon TNT 1-94 [Tanacetum coccineum]
MADDKCTLCETAGSGLLLFAGLPSASNFHQQMIEAGNFSFGLLIPRLTSDMRSKASSVLSPEPSFDRLAISGVPFWHQMSPSYCLDLRSAPEFYFRVPYGLGVAPEAIINRQLPFEYTITSRLTDVVVECQMAQPVQSINHSAFRSMFEREKLSGNNFIWFHQLKLVLRVEKKMFVIEQTLPADPAVDSDAQVLLQWNAIYDAYNEVACLILGSMTPELHRQFENSSPYDMIKELKAMFEKQVGVERFDLIQTFHACKQEEGKPVAAYVIKMKGYVDQLECIGYMLPQDLIVGLILNGLTKDFMVFMRNYNMHNMGKTIGELHAMLIEYEKSFPKKAETPQVMMIKGGKIQKAKKKSLKAKGKGKVNGKGNDKQVYIPKPKNPKPSTKEHPTKDDTRHHCKEAGHWKRNCPVYLAELLKKKKQVGSASSSRFREARKLKQGALYLKLRCLKSCEPYNANDITDLLEQNERLRAEIKKIKQHYKEIFESIKITRNSTNEQTSSLLTQIEDLKAQIEGNLKVATRSSIKTKVLAPGMYVIDVKPIPHPIKNNRSAHLNYINHLKESVETELLEYVIGTCPKSFNERDNKAPSTPITRKKQVTLNDKPGTSSRVSSSTRTSGSKPRSNTKHNRILPAKSVNNKKVEDHPRINKSIWTKVNRVDSSISSKHVVINSNSESVCKTCNKCLNSANHEMCVVNILSSVNATPTVKIVLNKGKQIWKPKGKLSDNSLNKTKQVWKATGKLFANVGYQWRSTGKKVALGKLNCGYQWRPTGKKFALGELCPLTRLPVTCGTDHPLVSGLRLFKTYDGESFKAQELCGKVHRCDLQSILRGGTWTQSILCRAISLLGNFGDFDLEIAFQKAFLLLVVILNGRER